MDQTLYPIVYEYYSVLIWSAPYALFVPTMEYIIRAEGKPGTASFITVLANVINVVLDIVSWKLYREQFYSCMV